MLLLLWYAVLCLVLMPLDSRIAKAHSMVPPALTLTYTIVSAVLFYDVYLAYFPEDLEFARSLLGQWGALQREDPLMFLGIAGIVVLPVLWQAETAYREWKKES